MKAIRVLGVGCWVLGAALAQQPVNVVQVVAKASDRKVPLPGEFVPYQAVDVRAKVAGFVERVEVDRGSLVKEGQLLATLVAPELAAQRKEAEARVQSVRSSRAEAEAKLLSAQSTYERLEGGFGHAGRHRRATS